MARGALMALLLFGCTRENSSSAIDMAGPRADEQCFAGGACGSSGNYRLCVSMSGGPCTARYLTSDGASFQCASCSDCQSALANVARWCGGTTTSGTTAGTTTSGTTAGTTTSGTTAGTTTSGTTAGTTTSGTTTSGTTTGGSACSMLARADCLDCCDATQSTGRKSFYAKYRPCICNASTCLSSCASSFCSSALDAGATDFLCQLCAYQQETLGGTCNPRTLCGSDSACNAWLDCGDACPAN